jgi:hypothetical protein
MEALKRSIEGTTPAKGKTAKAGKKREEEGVGSVRA